MFGRNREDMVDAKAMKLRYFGSLLLRINFVDDDIQRFAGPAQKLDKFLIGRCDAASAIGHEENECRRFNCNLRLLENPYGDLRLFARAHAAGVHYFIRASMPVEDAVDAVACNSRFVCNDRSPLADKTVEQCRFSNVRTSNYSDKRW